MSPTASFRLRFPSPNRHYDKAQAFIDNGQIKEAIVELKNSLHTTPGHYGTIHDLTMCYLALEHYEESVKWGDLAAKINPHDDTMWYNKALALKKLEKYEDALESIERSLEIVQKNDNAWILKGNILGRLGDEENSIVCYDNALAINPHNSLARNNKVKSLQRLGRTADITKTQEEGEQLNKDDPQSFFLKGIDCFKANKYKEAIELFDKSLRMHPDPTVKQYKNFALEKLREIDDLVNWKPNTINELYKKSTKLASLGKNEEVIKCCDEILKIAPNQETANFNKGVTLVKLGNDAEGMIYIKKAEKINPNNPIMLTSIGAINFDKGNYSEAIDYYKKALKIDPNFPKAIKEISLVLIKLGIKESVFCAKCGAKNKSLGNFCVKCGDQIKNIFS